MEPVGVNGQSELQREGERRRAVGKRNNRLADRQAVGGVSQSVSGG